MNVSPSKVCYLYLYKTEIYFDNEYAEIQLYSANLNCPTYQMLGGSNIFHFRHLNRICLCNQTDWIFFVFIMTMMLMMDISIRLTDQEHPHYIHLSLYFDSFLTFNLSPDVLI